MKLDIKSIEYHRNGISGVGFHVVRWTENRHNMLACVFKDPGHLAVLDLDDLTQCWRGDHYEADLWKAVKKYCSLKNSYKAD